MPPDPATASPPGRREPSLVRRAARLLELGVGLGVVSSVAATLLGYELASRLDLWHWKPGPLTWAVRRLGVEQLGPLLVAPLACALAARLFDGLRWPFAAAVLATLQLSTVLQRAVFAGFGSLLDPEDLALLVLPGLAGFALACWGIRRQAPGPPRLQTPGPRLRDPDAGPEAPGS